MAVPKKRVSKTRKNLRHTNWKKELIPQALKALSFGKSLRMQIPLNFDSQSVNSIEKESESS